MPRFIGLSMGGGFSEDLGACDRLDLPVPVIDILEGPEGRAGHGFEQACFLVIDHAVL